MGIGGVTSMSNMSGMQMTMAGSTDSKSKSIQNEITRVQQQMQKLSSEDELSVSEKANEQKKLQKEISSLNTELKQHQEEFRKSQRREIMMAELQTAKEPEKEEKKEDASAVQTDRKETDIAGNKDSISVLKEEINQDGKLGADTGKVQAEKIGETEKEALAAEETKDTDDDTDNGLSGKDMYALSSSDISLEQASRLGTVIARIKDGIAILKGEINQDEKQGIDTGKKQEELKKMEQSEQRAKEFQFSILGEANQTMQTAAAANVPETKSTAQTGTENNAFQFLNQEEQESQQLFHVALGH